MKEYKIYKSAEATREKFNKVKKFKLKSEKGSITLFVLVSMLFMLIALVLSYGRVSTKKTTEARQIKQIEDQYTVTDSEMEQEYKKLF